MTIALAAGIVAATGFVVTFLVDGATRPGYDPVRHPVSALALGSRGWVQTTNFVVSGTLIAASALGLHQATSNGWLGVLVGVFGLALIASGVFPMDPMRGYPPGTPDTTPPTFTRTHTLHDWAGILVFSSLPAAALAAALSVDDTFWTALSAVTALVLVVLFVIFGSAWEADSPQAGLIQRVLIVTGWTWLGLVCWHLMP